MELSPAQYLRWIAGCVGGMTVAVVLMNVVVDPFDRHELLPDLPLPKQEISYAINRPLFEFHRFDRFLRETEGRPRCVVVGDSRANQLDERILNAASDARWFNFAFGGATFGDSLVLAQILVERKAVDVLVFSLSFLRFNGTSHEQQVRRAFNEYDSPFPYIMPTSTRASLENLLHAATGWRITQSRPRMTKQAFWEYTMARMQDDLTRWTWPDVLLDSLHTVRRAARDNGVHFVLMVPPASPDLARLIRQLRPAEVERFNALLAGTDCIDLRRGFGANLTNDHFRDPLHLEHASAAAFSHAFIRAFHEFPQAGQLAVAGGRMPHAHRPSNGDGSSN